MLQCLFTPAQTVVVAATLALDIGEAQLDSSLHLIAGMAFECLQQEGPCAAESTSVTLHESAAVEFIGRQHLLMMT